MKAIYMGTPEISAVILEKLIKTDIEILAVVTQPDKPKGRRKEITFSGVKKTALSHQIPVLQPVRARDQEFIDQIQAMNPDIILVAAFGQILPKALLDMPKYGCINVHTSLLPKYRGAAPIQWTVINGEEKTGVTIMYMDEGIDTGDMILKKELLIDRKETGGSLHDRLALLGADALIEALELIKTNQVVRIPQFDKEATYVKILTKTDGLIDFEKSADSIERLVRGLNPWPSAYSYYKGKMLKIWDCEVISVCDGTHQDNDYCVGTIVASDKEFIYVKTGSGTLKICELQLEGKKRMLCSEFLKGYPVQIGECFGQI